MKWRIPAKTFLLGEYAAVEGLPAIIVTTDPAFEVNLTNEAGVPFHINSPAGRYWQSEGDKISGLKWRDPYAIGGLGASSAEFLGVYYANCYLKKRHFSIEDLMQTYLQYVANGEGSRPSGYDLWAQAMGGCVYLDKASNIARHLVWNFNDIDFILIHTQKKLTTHTHLQQLDIKHDFSVLAEIVNRAYLGFKHQNSQIFIDAVQEYYKVLNGFDLVCDHTKILIENITQRFSPLAIKGCGALGADVILMVVPSVSLIRQVRLLRLEGWRVVATSRDISVPKI